jgi:hypothetical protein
MTLSPEEVLDRMVLAACDHPGSGASPPMSWSSIVNFRFEVVGVSFTVMGQTRDGHVVLRVMTAGFSRFDGTMILPFPVGTHLTLEMLTEARDRSEVRKVLGS